MRLDVSGRVHTARRSSKEEEGGEMLIGSRVVHDRSAQACAQVLAASRNAAAVSC